MHITSSQSMYTYNTSRYNKRVDQFIQKAFPVMDEELNIIKHTNSNYSIQMSFITSTQYHNASVHYMTPFQLLISYFHVAVSINVDNQVEIKLFTCQMYKSWQFQFHTSILYVIKFSNSVSKFTIQFVFFRLHSFTSAPHIFISLKLLVEEKLWHTYPTVHLVVCTKPRLVAGLI